MTYLIPIAIALPFCIWAIWGEVRAARERRRRNELADSFIERYRRNEGQ
jgi:hypothetical protein